MKAGDAVEIDETLNPGSAGDVSVVEWLAQGAAPAEAGSSGVKIAVKDIPLANRNYTQAAGLDAGVTSQVSNATNIGINTVGVQVGGSSTSSYEMDGAPVTTPLCLPYRRAFPIPTPSPKTRWSRGATPPGRNDIPAPTSG